MNIPIPDIIFILIKSYIYYMNLHNYDVSIYVGQMIDGPQNGTAPGPWDIAASPPSLFQDYVQHFEVPHTASVKVKKITLHS